MGDNRSVQFADCSTITKRLFGFIRSIGTIRFFFNFMNICSRYGTGTGTYLSLVNKYPDQNYCEKEGIHIKYFTSLGPLLCRHEGLRNNPGTVDDFFRLNARFMQRAPLHYLQVRIKRLWPEPDIF